MLYDIHGEVEVSESLRNTSFIQRGVLRVRRRKVAAHATAKIGAAEEAEAAAAVVAADMVWVVLLVVDGATGRAALPTQRELVLEALEVLAATLLVEQLAGEPILTALSCSQTQRPSATTPGSFRRKDDAAAAAKVIVRIGAPDDLAAAPAKVGGAEAALHVVAPLGPLNGSPAARALLGRPLDHLEGFELG
jgi:hypothetical protein